ncbi:MAG: helix-turn-helix domain-containing protein [Oscillospiraceae bacterium]|jgi:transcriptional regulator with XRE-family HTH domain|nr:helix-turn-helix domain-containing protein [Oscillospiraceae bacterium]
MDKKAIQAAFGNNLRKYRSINGKNQEEFAFTADMSAAYLSELERGEKCPTIDTVYKICRALHITVAELLDFDAGEQAESEAFLIIKNALKTAPDKNKLKLARVFERFIDLYNED